MEERIMHEFSTPYTPQQNGVVEGKNMKLINMVRMMLEEYTCESVLGGSCDHILPRHKPAVPSRLLKKTSYELFTGNNPIISYFRVFGSKYYILVKKAKNLKYEHLTGKER
jgi:hypothetical protein